MTQLTRPALDKIQEPTYAGAAVSSHHQIFGVRRLMSLHLQLLSPVTLHTFVIVLVLFLQCCQTEKDKTFAFNFFETTK